MGEKRFHEQSGSVFIDVGQTLAHHAVYTQVSSLEMAGELHK